MAERDSQRDRAPERTHASGDHARARTVLGAYGAVPARWPVGERDGVLSSANSDLTVAAQRRREAALDGLLDSAPRHVPAAALMARIRLAAVTAPHSGWSVALDLLFGDVTRATLMRSATALSAAVVLGVGLGTWWTPAEEPDLLAEEYVTLAFAHDLLSGGGFGETSPGSVME